MYIVVCLLFLLLITGCLQRQSLMSEESQAQIRQLLVRGSQYYEDEQYAEALKTFQEALSVVATTEHPRLTADIYHRVGNVQLRLQLYGEALTSFKRALDLIKRVDSRQDEAVLHNAIGGVYQTLGEVALAKEHYTQALRFRREARDRLGEARTLANLASIYFDEGQYGRALELYESVSIFLENHTPRVPRDTGAILTNIGALYSALGQYEKALDFHYRAVKAYEEAKDPRGVVAALHNIGVTHFRKHDYAPAIQAFERALANRKTEDRLGRAKTLNSLGLALSEARQESQGLRALSEALDIFQTLNSQRYVAATLDSIGSVYKNLGDHSTALSHYHRSLVIWFQLGDREGERVTLGNLGLLHRERQQPEFAIFYLKHAVNASQRLRAEAKGLEQELQHSLTKRLENPYRALAELLIQEGRLPEAEQVLAMLKEHEQFEFVRSDAVSDPRTTVASMTPRERELAERLNDSARKLFEVHAKMEKLRGRRELSPEEERTWENLNEQFSVENEKVFAYLQEIQEKLAVRDSSTVDLIGLAKTRGATSDTLSKLDQDTGKRTALVYFLPLANATTFLISTQNGLLALHAGVGEKQLNARIAALRKAIDKRDDSYRAIAADLYDALIRPLEAALRRAEVSTLMLYLTDALRYLPFAALYDTASSSHLVEKYSLVMYTHVGREHLRSPPATRWSAIALGTSRKIGKHDPLPAVRYELARVVRDPRDKKPDGILEGKRHLDEEFSRKVFERLLNAGASFPVMHIATHFTLVPGSDDRSALLLGDGQEMTLREIRGRAQMSGYELVTLSACDTAVGDDVLSSDMQGIGAEVEGLGAILQQQGAKSVLATLWKVQDAGTARLMEEFYRTRGEDRQTTKADALRQAQLALLQGNVKADAPNIGLTHPYYWAPFVLMGNWM